MEAGDNILPPGWIESTLGEAFIWGSGGTPKRDVNDYFDGSIPWAIIGDLNDGLVSATKSTLTEKGLRESSARWVSRGSVLLAMYGASIGKLGLAAIDLTTNQAIAFTKPEPVFGRYLFWYLSNSKHSLVNQGKGGAQNNISQTIIKAFPFPLAPLPEQRRIVAEIEKHITRLDAAVASLKRAQATLKRYRASVLKAACEGNLVPTEAELARAENRDYEPADVLLRRILKERRIRWEADELAKIRARGREPKDDKWKAKYKEPIALDASDLPDLPEGWVWGKLMAITALKGGLTMGKKRNSDTKTFATPYLRVANVQRGYLDLTEIKTIDATQDEIRELVLKPGDVLLTEGGDRDKLGRGWVWNEEIEGCIHQNHIFRARLINAEYSPKFLSFYTNSGAQEYMNDRGKQTTNLASISLTVLTELPVPNPPLAEQHRIVAEVERRLSVIQASEDIVEANLRRAERLRQSILKKAFEGNLVPQDPNDEPASVLLDRIRAERAAAQPAKKPRRSGTSRGPQMRLKI